MRLGARLGRFFDGSMRANAFALVTHQLASAALGFGYWVLAARLYSVKSVGASAASISALQLVSGLAQLGLVSGMQRFIPRAGRHARRLAASAYAIASISAAFAGVVALWVTSTIAGRGEILGGVPPALVVLAAVSWTLFYLQDGVLVGLRQAPWVLAENFAYNVAKIVLLVIGARLLFANGILASWFLPVPVAVLLVTWLVFGRLLRVDRLHDHRDPAEQVTAREVVRSISGDHVGSLVNEAGVRLLPLLVVRLSGVAANAYFYQAWTISTVFALVAGAMANSFMAETAADRTRVGANSRTILRTMALVLVPASVLVLTAAPLILRVFGPAYAREASLLLRLFAVAVVPVAINAWYVSYLRVMGGIRRLIAVQVLSAFGLIALTLVALPALGITGVGAAYLLAQTAVAAYALADTRAVLRAAIQPAADSLRQADWRFLLPVPRPGRIGVQGDGQLARSARLLDAEPADISTASDLDLCLLEEPDDADLQLAARALRPGGSCLVEWHATAPGGIATIRRRLRRAGFDEPLLYWPAPSLRAPRLWIRIPPPDAGYRRVVRDLLLNAVPKRLTGQVISAGATLAMRLGALPGIVSLATTPSPKTVERDFAQWLGDALRDLPGAQGGVAAIMRTGGSYDESKVNWLLFGMPDYRLRWIAKAPRHPDSEASLEREHAALEMLASRPPMAFKVPHPVMHTRTPGFPLFVQTALSGTHLARAAESLGYASVAATVSAALASLPAGAPRLPESEWRDRLVEPWLDRLESQLAGLPEAAVVADARRVLRELGELPLALTHNDCTPWNIVLDEDGLGLFDWEMADAEGLPAVDLVYCLASLAFSLDGTEGTPRAVDSYRRLLDVRDDRGAAFEAALKHYAAVASLDDADLSQLRVATWLVHTTHDLHNRMVGRTVAQAIEDSICLPVLRAELDRHLQGVASQAAALEPSTRAEALFISPHLDDAVLSCGSAIRRLVTQGYRVIVATVFTEDLPPTELPSRLASACHAVWAAGDRPFATRRAEDLEALEVLGAEALHLGFHDAIYRRSGDGEQLYPASQLCDVHAEDDREPLIARLQTLFAEHPQALVFAPAGIGGHVDHLLVRQAVEAAAPARLVYYDEYPYSAWSAGAEGASDSPAFSFQLRPAADELAARLAAARRYATQLPGLFPSPTGRLCRILRDRFPRACSWLPLPDDPESAARRMRWRVGRDAGALGETYHWADLAWAGPFGADRPTARTL